jgi:hypothetical protein
MAEPVVAFTIAPTVAQEAEDAVLAAVGFVDGVARVERVSPGSTIPEIRRMGVAILSQDLGAPPSEVVTQRIRALPGIESAEVAPDRGL